MDHFDDVVVGAGAAGCAIAARLSEDPGRTVAVVEAGPFYPTVAATPADLLDPYAEASPAHLWQFTAERVPGRVMPYVRGRVAGGCSSVNACIALRGVPADYDAWAERGSDLWSWDAVLPYFRRLEHDHDAGGPLHGTEGPIHISRRRREAMHVLSNAMLDACADAGFAEVRDHNDPGASGAGPAPLSVRDGIRNSALVGYLQPAAARPGVTVLDGCEVARVVFRGTRAAGVDVVRDGRLTRLHAGRVILSAGAICTPAILMRSGIGAAEHLASVGIPVVADVPGVGASVLDHATYNVDFVPRPGVCDVADRTTEVLLRFTTPGSAAHCDAQLSLTTRQDYGKTRPRLAARLGSPVAFTLSVNLMACRSSGLLRLADNDPSGPPLIRLNLLSDPDDLRRMAEALRVAAHIARSPRFEAYGRLPDGALDDRAIADEGALRGAVLHLGHICGTARMGPAADRLSVVDQRGRVRGVRDLYVADASIMPAVPRANTNLTSIMIGERLADLLRERSAPAPAVSEAVADG